MVDFDGLVVNASILGKSGKFQVVNIIGIFINYSGLLINICNPYITLYNWIGFHLLNTLNKQVLNLVLVLNPLPFLNAVCWHQLKGPYLREKNRS